MSDERYRFLFETSTDAIVVGDPDGTIREVNPAACRLFGYQADELIGRNGRELSAPKWLAIAAQRAERKAAGARGSRRVRVGRDRPARDADPHRDPVDADQAGGWSPTAPPSRITL
jgi:PAS domain S-box-containing protein